MVPPFHRNDDLASPAPGKVLGDTVDLGELELDSVQESAWVEVIGKMEEVYSDLIRYEVDLEKKNAELETAQRFISSVVESVSDVLVVCDHNLKVQRVNRALLDLTGLSEGSLIDQPMRRLLAPQDSSVLTMIHRDAQVGQSREWEVRFNTRDGLSDMVAITASPRVEHDGRRAGFVLTGRPVGELRRAYDALNSTHAELKQAQQQLIQQEKMASLGRLVAGVAHELNNPISFIYGNVHMLSNYRERLVRYLGAVHAPSEIGAPELDALRRELRIDDLLDDLASLVSGTLEGAARVSEIVKNLRRLSFTQTGPLETFDVASVVRTATQWAVRGGDAGVRIDYHLPDGLTVVGRSGQIHQVIVNLVQNALAAVGGAPKKIIAVSGETSEGTVRISVADSGPGIAQDGVDKIFEPFFTTKDVGEGTGLGLWISYGFVKEHGGDIEVTSSALGGAMFVVSLPALPDENSVNDQGCNQ